MLHFNQSIQCLLFFQLVFYSTVFAQYHQPISEPTFVENKGQWPEDVRFMTEVPGGYMWIGHRSFRTSMLSSNLPHGGEERKGQQFPHSIGHCYDLEFVGGQAKTIQSNGGRGETRYNFFLGNNPEKWGRNAHAFEEVFLNQMYSGVDVRLYRKGGALKYDLEAADPTAISLVKIQYKGLSGLELKDGKLILKTSIGNIVESIPLAYQIIDGQPVSVSCRYQVANGIVSFVFPKGLKKNHPIVVDPEVVFYTHSGSLADNWGSSAVGDNDGNSYSAGTVYGPGFPATIGAFDSLYNGTSPYPFSFDVGIQKFNKAGNKLLFSTYLGGIESESPHSLNVDEIGNLLIFGTTSSADFPITAQAFQSNFLGGPTIDPMVNNYRYRKGSDLFITRLDSSGQAILGSTFLGGTNNDGLLFTQNFLTMNYGDGYRGDITSAADGSVYLASLTSSNDFPVSNAHQSSSGGFVDGVVCRLSYGLDSLLWSTYLGGSEEDALFSIQMQGANRVVVCGGSRSFDFPIIAGAYQPNRFLAASPRKNASCDGVIASFSAETGGLLNSTFSGTSQYDQAYLTQTDPEGNVFIFGQTEGSMPKSDGKFGNANGRVFIQKFNPTLSTLIWGTTLGSTAQSTLVPSAFLVDSCGRIYISGWGGQSNYFFDEGFTGGTTAGFPVSFDAFKATTNGSDFYFGVLGEDANSLVFGSYYGGSPRGMHVDGGMSRFSKSGVITQATCGCKLGNQFFPGTTGSYSPTIKSTNCNQGVIRIDLGALKAKFAINAILGCDLTVTFLNESSNANQFVWYWGDGDSLVSNQPTVSHTYLSAGNYLVTLFAKSIGTCQSIAYYSDTLTVENPFPFVSDTVSYSYCKGDAFFPNIPSFFGIEKKWLTTNDIINGDFVNPFIRPSSPRLYTIEYTNSRGCKRNKYFQTIAKPSPTVSFLDSFELERCKAQGTYHARAYSDTSDFYFWRVNTAEYFGSSIQFPIENQNPILIFLKGSLGGCQDSMEVLVQVPPLDFKVVSNFHVKPNLLDCSEKEIAFLNTSTKAQSYRWDFGDGEFSTEKEPIHRFSAAGLYQVKLTASNSYCDSTLQLPIEYKPILIPSLFTPNGDGKNETFQILNVEESFSLDVYNRWGEKVYASEKYGNDWSANNLVEGVYFFQIRFQDNIQCASWVFVVKE